LDEFQDTSFGQWSILRSLIDEAVQDPTGARTFFYVGDVKQAIFAWREGDPRLFREIFDHYNQSHPGCIAEKHLVQSWRSGPPIISIVNRVFGDAGALAGLFPGEASDSWNREWRAHESARPALGGHVAWLQADEEDDRFSTTLALLAEIEPLERGLSCAVLVRKNDTANRLADFLRREGGLAAVAESDLHVCVDNPLGQALLALAQAAAHPGDTLAWEHVRMTPLGEVLRAQGMDSPERLTSSLLGEVHAKGFERWAARWVGLIEPFLAPDDRFSRERGRQFIEAAGLFDVTGSREVAEFVRFMESHAVRENESAGAVRVMTIHKSKGLGFDVVILPDLEGNRLDLRREGLAVKKAQDRSVEWVVSLPAKDFVETDPVLSAYVREAEAAACYEALSLLYVAMTRAKRAMYLVTKAPGNSTSRNFPRLLAETLGDSLLNVRVGGREFQGFYQDGEADWFRDLAAAQAPSGSMEIGPVEVTPEQRRRRYPAQKASAGKRGELGGAQLFNLDSGNAAEFGTRVHRLLAEVEWIESGGIDHWAGQWGGRGEPEVIVNEAIACISAGELSRVWRGGAGRRVWRERAFEVVLDGRWVTGVFDRVVILHDTTGRPTEATVYDFKTDFLSSSADAVSAADRYRHQMTFYRRVVARLAGLAEESVRAEVIFTGLRTSVRVENH
jgi:ATP-dependent helicase/nuclease subunit A